MIKPKPKPAIKAKVQKSPLVPSEAIKVYDIPMGSLVESEENPNVQDDRTFDALVQSIKDDGFCEPVNVIPFGDKYKIVSGHHRSKALRMLKWPSVPCVIHKDWDETKRKIKLVQANMLRGNLNPEKFTALFNELARAGVDKELLQAQMGFTKKDAFDKLYKNISNSLPARQKKQLADAKESIKSVDDLSSVLNTIFKEHGSELEQGFMVFSFGGKNHHYIQIDKELDTFLMSLEAQIMESGADAKEIFKRILLQGEKSVTLPVRKKIKIRPKPKAA